MNNNNHMNNNNRVCPVEKAKHLDSFFRKMLQNPQKILRKYINKGMTVLDFGCGPGFFTIEIAKLLGDNGKVFAVDLQDGMLQILKNKIEDSILASRIHIHKCKEDSIDFTEKVDFILAFYVIHEVPNQAKLFKEFKSILNPNGAILIVEPKRHVSKTNFEMMINTLKDLEFNILDRPKVFQSRAIYLTSN